MMFGNEGVRRVQFLVSLFLPLAAKSDNADAHLVFFFFFPEP